MAASSEQPHLHKSEKLLFALLESAAQAIVSTDRTGRIVLANDRTEEMFGYTREELVGGGIEMLLPESKRSSAHPAPRRLLRASKDPPDGHRTGAFRPAQRRQRVPRRSEPELRGNRRRGFRNRLRERHQPAQAARRAAHARPEDGSGGPPGRRGGARLQQHADRDHRVQPDDSGRAFDGRSAARVCRGDPQGRRPRRRAHQPVAGVQPPADHAAESDQRQRW